MTLTEHSALIQGTEEWHDQRRGIVTASVVGRLVASRHLAAIDYDCPACAEPPGLPCVSKVKKGGEAPAPIKTMHPERTSYAAERRDDTPPLLEPAANDDSRGLTALLVAERITGYTEPTYMNDDMFRGVYSEHYAPATETGFMVRDDWGFKIGYSPDGLIGTDGLVAGPGLLEVKSRRQKKHLLTILADEVPAENMAQLQCGLLVSGRAWIDYISYCGGMPMWKKRVTPDPRWFDAIVAAVRLFEKNAAEMTDRYLKAVDGLPSTERVDYNEVELKL
jgi:hypothetical protein